MANNKKNNNMKNNKENGDTAKEAKKKLLAAKKQKINDEEAKEIKNKGISVYYDLSHGAVFDNQARFYDILVHPQRGAEEVKLRFIAHGLKFLQFVNYNKHVLLNFELDGKEFTESFQDAKTLISHEFSLTPVDSKALIQFIRQLYYDTFIPIIVKKDKIRIENGKIVVDKPDDYSKEKLQFIYKTLSDYYPYAAKPIAYLALFGHSILSPFFTYVRRHSLKKLEFPLIFLHGPTGGGKTTTAQLFIQTGFAQEENYCFFNKNNVKTDFTMSKKLGLSYNPSIIDEVDESWLLSMIPYLKSYTQSISTASRGTPSQLLKEYEGLSAFVMTTNSSIRPDDDLALIEKRLFDIEYTLRDTQRQDDGKFNDLILSLPPGFMYYILYDIMNGVDVNQLLKEILYFKKDDFINYGIKRINESLKQFNIPEFPLFHYESHNEYSNAQEFVDKILSEDEKPNSFLSTEFKIEDYDNKIDIFFTGGMFKAMNERLRLPYSNATDFMSNLPPHRNIISPNGGRLISKKISKYAKKCFYITVLKENESKEKTENSPYNSTSDSTRSNYNIDNLPDGPVKDELVQNKEDIENEKLKHPEEKSKQQPAETLPENANQEITKDFIEEIRETLETENFMLDGNHGLSFDKKDFQLYVHPTDLPLDRFTRLKDIMKGFGFQYSLIQAPYGIRFIRKIRGGINE